MRSIDLGDQLPLLDDAGSVGVAARRIDDLRDRIKDTGLWPVLMRGPQEPTPVLGLVRSAMRNVRVRAPSRSINTSASSTKISVSGRGTSQKSGASSQ